MKLNPNAQRIGKPALRYPIKAQRGLDGISITWLILICTINPEFKAGFFRVHERSEYFKADEEKQRSIINALYRIRKAFHDEFGTRGVENILRMPREVKT